MVTTILDILIGGGVIFAIVGLFYPEMFYAFVHYPTEIPYKKKDAWKHRLWAALFILFAMALYIYDNFYH